MKRYFVGSKNICDSLEYVMNISFNKYYNDSAEIGKIVDPDVIVVYEKDAIIEWSDVKDNWIELNKYVKVMDKAFNFGEKKVLCWGNGGDLKNIWEIINSNVEISGVIDSNIVDVFELEPMIPLILYDSCSISKDTFFIIITTSRYKFDIQKILEDDGWVYGKDFVAYEEVINNFNNSEMFLKTVYDTPKKKIACKRPFEYINVGPAGRLTHCCYAWLPYEVGNINDVEAGRIDTIRSRILKLSFVNHTYTFCNTQLCSVLKNNFVREEKEEIFIADEIRKMDDKIQKSRCGI